VLPLTVSARPVLVDPSHLAITEPRAYMMGRTIGPDQIRGGLPIIDLDGLATGDLKLRVTTLDVAAGRLQLQAAATVIRIPTAR